MDFADIDPILVDSSVPVGVVNFVRGRVPALLNVTAEQHCFESWVGTLVSVVRNISLGYCMALVVALDVMNTVDLAVMKMVVLCWAD